VLSEIEKDSPEFIMSETVSQPWAHRIRRELEGNILPFWMDHAVDQTNGRFYRAIDCDGHVEKKSPRRGVGTTSK